MRTGRVQPIPDALLAVSMEWCDRISGDIMSNVFQSAITVKAIYNNATDGELTDSDLAALESACGSIESFAEHVRDQGDECASRISCRKARIDQLQSANRADENRQERLKARLADAMKLAGMEKIKTAFVSCFWKRTEAVEVECEPSTLPLAFQTIKTTYSANKVALKAHHAAGGELPEGVTVVENESLQVR